MIEDLERAMEEELVKQQKKVSLLLWSNFRLDCEVALNRVKHLLAL